MKRSTLASIVHNTIHANPLSEYAFSKLCSLGIVGVDEEGGRWLVILQND